MFLRLDFTQSSAKFQNTILFPILIIFIQFLLKILLQFNNIEDKNDHITKPNNKHETLYITNTVMKDIVLFTCIYRKKIRIIILNRY